MFALYDKKEVPRSDLTSPIQLWQAGLFHCVTLYYKDTPQMGLIIFEDRSEVRGVSCVGIGLWYNDNIGSSKASKESALKLKSSWGRDQNG